MFLTLFTHFKKYLYYLARIRPVILRLTYTLCPFNSKAKIIDFWLVSIWIFESFISLLGTLSFSCLHNSPPGNRYFEVFTCSHRRFGIVLPRFLLVFVNFPRIVRHLCILCCKEWFTLKYISFCSLIISCSWCSNHIYFHLNSHYPQLYQCLPLRLRFRLSVSWSFPFISWKCQRLKVNTINGVRYSIPISIFLNNLDFE